MDQPPAYQGGGNHPPPDHVGVELHTNDYTAIGVLRSGDGQADIPRYESSNRRGSERRWLKQAGSAAGSRGPNAPVGPSGGGGHAAASYATTRAYSVRTPRIGGEGARGEGSPDRRGDGVRGTGEGGSAHRIGVARHDVELGDAPLLDRASRPPPPGVLWGRAPRPPPTGAGSRW